MIKWGPKLVRLHSINKPVSSLTTKLNFSENFQLGCLVTETVIPFSLCQRKLRDWLSWHLIGWLVLNKLANQMSGKLTVTFVLSRR